MAMQPESAWSSDQHFGLDIWFSYCEVGTEDVSQLVNLIEWILMMNERTPEVYAYISDFAVYGNWVLLRISVWDVIAALKNGCLSSGLLLEMLTGIHLRLSVAKPSIADLGIVPRIYMGGRNN